MKVGMSGCARAVHQFIQDIMSARNIFLPDIGSLLPPTPEAIELYRRFWIRENSNYNVPRVIVAL